MWIKNRLLQICKKIEVDLNLGYTTDVYSYKWRVNTMSFICLHPVLQLQQRLQHKGFLQNFWTSATNFALRNGIAIRVVFFLH